MIKHAKVTLGDIEYTIPAFTIGQLERIAEALTLPDNRSSFNVLRVALERAVPKVDNPNDVEMTIPQLAAAADEILRLSGMVTASPTVAPNGGTAPS